MSLRQIFSATRAGNSSLADGVSALENGQGFVASRRHYTQVVMTLQPSVIDRGVPQIVKGKVLNPRPLAPPALILCITEKLR